MSLIAIVVVNQVFPLPKINMMVFPDYMLPGKAEAPRLEKKLFALFLSQAEISRAGTSPGGAHFGQDPGQGCDGAAKRALLQPPPGPFFEPSTRQLSCCCHARSHLPMMQVRWGPSRLPYPYNRVPQFEEQRHHRMCRRFSRFGNAQKGWGP